MNRRKSGFRREEGSSLILALIYLLVCVFVSGAVLTAAGANRARAEQMRQERQVLLRNRSAMGTLASLLTDTPALTVRDVTWEGERRVVFSIPEDGPNPNGLQNLLYTWAVGQYALEHHVSPENMKFENFTPDSLSGGGEGAGVVELELKYRQDGVLQEETMTVDYSLSGTGELVLELPGFRLRSSCYFAAGTPVAVTVEGKSAETVTTVFCWENPIPEKGGSQ